MAVKKIVKGRMSCQYGDPAISAFFAALTYGKWVS